MGGRVEGEAVGASCSGVFHNLLNGGGTVKDGAQPVVAQGAHTLLEGLLLDHEGGRAFDDEIADTLAHAEPLVDAHAPAVAAVGTVLAAFAVEKLTFADVDGVDVELLK